MVRDRFLPFSPVLVFHEIETRPVESLSSSKIENSIGIFASKIPCANFLRIRNACVI